MDTKIGKFKVSNSAHLGWVYLRNFIIITRWGKFFDILFKNCLRHEKYFLYSYMWNNSFCVGSEWESKNLANGTPLVIMNVLLKHNLGYIKQYFGVFLELMDVNICTNFILLRYSEHGWLIGVYPLVMQTRQNIVIIIKFRG
jgi:hypothetical protein